MGPKKKVGKKKGGKKKVKIPIDDKLPLLVATDTKVSAINHAVIEGDLSSLKRLVTHYNHGDALKQVDVNGSTPIHLAVKKNDYTMLEGILNMMLVLFFGT